MIILVHGLNEHVGRYRNVIEHFKDAYALYLFDHRGHGRSDGVRSHVESFDDYVEDLNVFVKTVRKEIPAKRIFIIGHSMGGQVVINYVEQYRKAPVAGFITSSANIRIKVKIGPFKKFLGLTLARHAPKVMLANDIDPNWISRDPKVVRAYREDPLVGKKISVNLASEILKNQETIMRRAPRIKIPALLLHAGDDRICDKEGTIAFFEKLGSKDKELKIYPGMFHEIFNEIGREEVLKDVRNWIEKRVMRGVMGDG